MAYQIKNKEGEVIQRDGKDMMASDIAGVVKGVNLDKRTLRILATDETRDRDGDIVSMKGWDFENFIKNPVFLWGHDYSSVPLAAAVKMERKRNPSRLVLTHKFPTPGVHPFADMILQLYHERVINAGSVGFIPFDWEEIKDGEEDKPKRRGWSNRKFTKQELLEHSGCAVPSNPNAVQESIASAMKAIDFKYDDKVKLYRAFSGEQALELSPEEKAAAEEELAELFEKGVEFEEDTKIQVQVPVDLDNKENEKKDSADLLDNYPLTEPYEEGSIFIDPDGTATEFKDHSWTVINPNLLLIDNYKGLQDLFDEIFDGLIADSLAVELDDYRKRLAVLLKVGAVLNRKNKSLLKQASENILSVLENAGDGSDAEANDSTTQASLEADEEEEVITRFDAILNDDTAQASGEVVRVQPQKVVPLPLKKRDEQIVQVITHLEKLTSTLSKLM